VKIAKDRAACLHPDGGQTDSLCKIRAHVSKKSLAPKSQLFETEVLKSLAPNSKSKFKNLSLPQITEIRNLEGDIIMMVRLLDTITIN
jgi:hypothetical protein